MLKYNFTLFVGKRHQNRLNFCSYEASKKINKKLKTILRQHRHKMDHTVTTITQKINRGTTNVNMAGKIEMKEINKTEHVAVNDVFMGGGSD